MEYLQADLMTVERPREDDLLAQPPTSVRLRRIIRDGGGATRGLVRCVSSGYLSGGCSCEATIPLAAVMAAWERQLGAGRVRKDGYFHFAWHDEVWLAYGMSDGRIRGVYCPAHAAERDERSFTGEVGPERRGGKLPTTV